MEVVPYAKCKKPDDGTGNGQVDHGDYEQPIQEHEANGNVVLLNHGPDRERPGNEKEYA